MQPSICLVSLTLIRGVCRACFGCQLCQVWEADIKDPHHWWGGFEGQSLGCRESWCSRGNSYRVSCCYTCNVIVAFFGNQLSTSSDFHCTLQSLSGFTSPVESVSFDSSEVTIGAGAASGTIKIWNIEEAKGINQCRHSTVHWKHELQLCHAIISVSIDDLHNMQLFELSLGTDQIVHLLISILLENS